jgi:sulfur carrier protein
VIVRTTTAADPTVHIAVHENETNLISYDVLGGSMRVNGKDIELTLPMTVRDLILKRGFREDRVAVELNGRIIPRSEYANVPLNERDNIEIVGFVGGG